MRADERSAASGVAVADGIAFAAEADEAVEAEDVAVADEDKLKRRPGLSAGRAIIEGARDVRPSGPPRSV
jgi:hypothetical protein